MAEPSKESQPEEENAGEAANPATLGKDIFNDDGFLLAEFNPVPYIFILKDAYGNVVSLPPNRLLHARIECPRFHVLLDHLMAVLWSFYSKTGLDLLESNQIHWALKILEGTKNSQGQYTTDVQMAIDHLTDAYVDVCSNSNVAKLENRSYVQTPSPRRPRRVDSEGRREVTSSYEGFKADITQHMILKNASLHLADMISDADPDIIKELLVTDDKMPAEEYLCIRRESTPGPIVRNEDLEVQKDMVTLRNSKFQEMVNILEEIKQLDKTIQDLPANSSDALKTMLADVLEKSDASDIGKAD